MIRTLIHPHGDSISLPIPKEYVNHDLVVTIATVEENQLPLPKRQLGWLQGQAVFSQDFNAPLDDFKDYQ